MINQFIIVGIIKEMPMNDLYFKLEVKRNYKNTDGVFECDVFDCYLWTAIARKIESLCKVGDLVIVKGRLVNEENICNMVAEQVVLLNKRI